MGWPSDVNNSYEWKSNWSSAFSVAHGQVIKNSKELSVELAKIAKSIRHTVNEIYKYETDNGHYHKLLEILSLPGLNASNFFLSFYIVYAIPPTPVIWVV